jgi:hypothetical protein
MIFCMAMKLPALLCSAFLSYNTKGAIRQLVGISEMLLLYSRCQYRRIHHQSCLNTMHSGGHIAMLVRRFKSQALPSPYFNKIQPQFSL